MIAGYLVLYKFCCLTNLNYIATLYIKQNKYEEKYMNRNSLKNTYAAGRWTTRRFVQHEFRRDLAVIYFREMV